MAYRRADPRTRLKEAVLDVEMPVLATFGNRNYAQRRRDFLLRSWRGLLRNRDIPLVRMRTGGNIPWRGMFDVQ